MSFRKNIIGKFNNGKNLQDCSGEIEISRIDWEHQTAYASWQIYYENKVSIAGKTKSYHFGQANNPQAEIFKLILIDVQKYRINRQKAFSEIEIK